MLVSHRLNGLYFASLYRNCIQFLPAETLAPQLEYRSFIKDAVQRTQKCRVLIKVLTPESRIFVAGENHVKIAFLVVATVDQVKEQPRIQAGSDTVLRFYLRQTVSKDGGAEVLCSPAGLITESDCGPVRRKVLATGVLSRAVTIPASELQVYLNSLPRLLTEHHDITLSGTCSQDVRMQDFYGSGSLTLRADDLGDCVFTGSVSIENCGVPVTLENLKWALGAEADSNTYCIDCCGGHISAQDCSFNGYASTDGGTAGNGVNTYPNTSAVLGNCAFHDLQNTVHTYLGGRVEIYGDNPKTDYSGNSVGAYTYWNGLVMLGAGVPTTLGASTNYRNSGGAIIQDGKLI